MYDDVDVLGLGLEVTPPVAVLVAAGIGVNWIALLVIAVLSFVVGVALLVRVRTP